VNKAFEDFVSEQSATACVKCSEENKKYNKQRD
jgi:hypothetical protein